MTKQEAEAVYLTSKYDCPYVHISKNYTYNSDVENFNTIYIKLISFFRFIKKKKLKKTMHSL